MRLLLQQDKAGRDMTTWMMVI